MRDEMSLKTGEIEDIERKIRRRARVTDLVGDAPAAAELHRARIDGVGAGMVNLAIALLDQQALNPAQPQLGRQRQPDGSAADDKNRCLPNSVGRFSRHDFPALLREEFGNLYVEPNSVIGSSARQSVAPPILTRT
jgi:hypothetical protein